MQKSDFSHIIIDNVIIHTCRYNDFNISSYLHYLNKDEQVRLSSFKNKKRQQEFVKTRILKHHLFGDKRIIYSDIGVPSIEKGPFISISHAKNIVAIAVCEKFQIGLDLETPQEKIKYLYPKFISEKELKYIQTDDLTQLTKVWSGKEVLYKLAGRKGVDFKKDLLLIPKDKNKWMGRILNPKEKIYVELDIFEKNGVVYSINHRAIEKEE